MTTEYLYASKRQVALAKLEVKLSRKLGEEPDPMALKLANAVLVEDSEPSTEPPPSKWRSEV